MEARILVVAFFYHSVIFCSSYFAQLKKTLVQLIQLAVGQTNCPVHRFYVTCVTRPTSEKLARQEEINLVLFLGSLKGRYSNISIRTGMSTICVFNYFGIPYVLFLLVFIQSSLFFMA